MTLGRIWKLKMSRKSLVVAADYIAWNSAPFTPRSGSKVGLVEALEGICGRDPTSRDGRCFAKKNFKEVRLKPKLAKCPRRKQIKVEWELDGKKMKSFTDRVLVQLAACRTARTLVWKH